MLGFRTSRKWIYAQKVTGPWQRLRQRHVRVAAPDPVRHALAQRQRQSGAADRPAGAAGCTPSARSSPRRTRFSCCSCCCSWPSRCSSSPRCSAACGAASPARRPSSWIPGSARSRSGSRATGSSAASGTKRAWTPRPGVAQRRLKWGVFLAISLVISMAFGSYFAGARELWTGQGSTAASTPSSASSPRSGSSTWPGSGSSSATTSAPTPGSRAR